MTADADGPPAVPLVVVDDQAAGIIPDAVKRCPPCKREDCEGCLTPMRESALNPYTCHTPGAGPCPRPTFDAADRAELGSYDYGIPGGE